MGRLWSAAAIVVLGAACQGPAPHRLTFAGRLTADNFAAEHVDGPASQGLVGDFYIRNDKLRAVIQAPGRAMGPCPWGGNLIDLDFVDEPAGDQLGEVAPLFGLGRTANFQKMKVVRDGSDGGAAVITAEGPDAINDFINIIGIAGFTVAAIGPALSPTLPLNLDVTATYTLAPGDSLLTVEYSLRNIDSSATKILFGTSTDTGAEIEVFHPGVGYGEFAITDFATGDIPTVEYVALQGQGISYGIVPVEKDPTTRGAPLPVGGVAVEAYEQTTFSNALTDAGRTVAIGPGATVLKTVHIFAARGGPGDIEAALRALQGRPTRAVSGTIDNGPSARVLFSTVEGAPVTVMLADANGAFSGALQAGDYIVEAEGDGWRRVAPTPFSVPADADPAPLALSLPDAALLSYSVHDDQGNSIPAKISVVGAPAAAPDRRFRDTIKDPLPYGLVAWLASLGGDSTLGTRWDHPLTVAPGHYRVVISRGPEWSRFEEELDLPSSGATVDATLSRVVDTSGYLAADFHQHTHKSPDCPVPPEDRLVANLADGVEYLSSSEHDFLFDYRPIIDSVGAGALIDSGVGVETTPFDYGHFIGWPLTVDPLQPNGGALDWGNGGVADLAPGQILDGLRAQGARVVQVNHPRTPPLSVSYQQNFDRAALTFDFLSHTFYSDTTSLEVSARDLGLPDDASLFSPKFDSVEVYLGYWPRPDLTVVDREYVDVLVDTILRDWFNFLSFGFTPTPVGDSDTHQRWSVPSGLPRTMVRVPDDSSSALQAGVGEAIAQTISGQTARDVVVTNGPMVRLAAGPDLSKGGMGSTVTLPSGATQLAVHVDAQSASWAPFDTVEIYANASFTIPPPPGEQPEPLQPVYCFTARAVPSWRCQQALGGARTLNLQTVTVGVGARVQASVDISLSLADLLGTVRPGAVGRDFWLVARVVGQQGEFPVIPAAVDNSVVTIDQLVSGAPLMALGVPPLAFTSAVFVDVDGGGWRAPFAP